VARLNPREHELRMKLYKQGCSNAEIARICGVAPRTILYWKRANGLHQEKGIPKGVPMETALTGEQCKTVRRVLSALLTAHDINPDVNVAEFLIAYRDGGWRFFETLS